MNKHTAIDQNGHAHTRNSANRVYTHCVVARRSYENALAIANDPWSVDASNYRFHLAFIDGTSEFLAKKSWQTEEQHQAANAENIADAKDNLAGCNSLADYRAKLKAKRIAGVEAAKAQGFYDKLVCLGWCGRRDLAEKSAAGYRANSYYAEVKILEAQVK